MSRPQPRPKLPAVVYRPGPRDRTVIDFNGKVIEVPAGWQRLPPGDATLTRRVKTTTEHYVVSIKRGRREFSQGVWADGKVIRRIESELAAHRQTPEYAKSKAAASRRREKVQTEYVEDFAGAVRKFLNFHDRHADLSRRLVDAVTRHATPVGSGTVARTKRIPIERRAEAAVIAWMRHQTTAYDSLDIPRVRGKRREVRRTLAKESKRLLADYRCDRPAAANCPLATALHAV